MKLESSTCLDTPTVIRKHKAFFTLVGITSQFQRHPIHATLFQRCNGEKPGSFFKMRFREGAPPKRGFLNQQCDNSNWFHLKSTGMTSGLIVYLRCAKKVLPCHSGPYIEVFLRQRHWANPSWITSAGNWVTGYYSSHKPPESFAGSGADWTVCTPIQATACFYVNVLNIHLPEPDCLQSREEQLSQLLTAKSTQTDSDLLCYEQLQMGWGGGRRGSSVPTIQIHSPFHS